LGDLDDWDAMMDRLSGEGLVYMSQIAIVPACAARKSGMVINIGSISWKEA